MSLKSIAQKVKEMFSQENAPETAPEAPKAETTETPEVKAEEIKAEEVEKKEEAPAAPDYEKRFADIDAALEAIASKLTEKKEDPVLAEAMSAIKELKDEVTTIKTEFASTKTNVEKLSKEPAGPVAGAPKKAVKVETAHVGLKSLLA